MSSLANPLPLEAERPPLRADEDGVVRVGDSRIRLDLVVEQYENGMAAEELVSAYETLSLADVHAVVAYYLRHRDEVQSYMNVRKPAANSLRAKIEQERPRVSRKELLARQIAREQGNASTGE